MAEVLAWKVRSHDHIVLAAARPVRLPLRPHPAPGGAGFTAWSPTPGTQPDLCQIQPPSHFKCFLLIYLFLGTVFRTSPRNPEEHFRKGFLRRDFSLKGPVGCGVSIRFLWETTALDFLGFCVPGDNMPT